jgi:hypothetical protein
MAWCHVGRQNTLIIFITIPGQTCAQHLALHLQLLHMVQQHA